MRKEAKWSSQASPESEEDSGASKDQQRRNSLKIITEKIGGDQLKCGSETPIDCKKEDSSSSNSFLSSTSSDLMEDASSFSSSSNGPLYQLSDLMAQLPIKRGLSKYYQGKSQSFTSLASVESLEDLAKRENPYKKRIKLCKSYTNYGGLDGVGGRCFSPKATISKKVSSRVSFSTTSSSSSSWNSNLMVSCRPRPPVPVQKYF